MLMTKKNSNAESPEDTQWRIAGMPSKPRLTMPHVEMRDLA